MAINNTYNPVQANEEINQLTHRIIGCAMQVHRTMGNGFQEVIYQRALAIEFTHQNIDFVREQKMDLYYREQHIGTRRVDFFVEGRVMLEIKAVEKLQDVHKAQAINYCEAYNIANGLLINFGSQSLDFKRVYTKSLSILKPHLTLDFKPAYNKNLINTKIQESCLRQMTTTK